MIEGNDLSKIGKYLFNVTGEDFAKDVYGKDSVDSYTREKFNKMQTNMIYWMGSLDSIRLANLAEAINNKGD